jgi:anti-sigma B factor antagonist
MKNVWLIVHNVLVVSSLGTNKTLLARSLSGMGRNPFRVIGKPAVMEIMVKELDHCDVISVSGYIERFTVAQLTRAVETSNERGKYNLIIDLSQVEYLSSAGYRALLVAQQNNRRNRRGELILAQVPEHVQQALELTGFGEFFHTFDDLSSAIEFAAQLPDDLPTDASLSKKTKSL